VLGQFGQNLGHRLVEIDLDDVFGELLLVDLRHVLRRIGLKLLEEDAVPGDLAEAWRSAEQETPRPIGSEAPWRGRRMTRTS
jgi:hypothetical protein